MSNTSLSKDINSEVLVKNAAEGRLVAAGTGDATKITGATLDRYGASKQAYQSCAVTALCHAVLAASKTMAVALELQDSADGSSWNTAVPLYASTVVLTDSGSGSTLTGEKTVGVDLSGYARFVRFNPTPDLNASGTDTAEIAVAAVFGGGRVLPAD